jgi:plastocyanin
MAKKVKKSVKKRATAPARSVSRKPHHPWDHHDLLLIVAGAFIVIILIVLFSGNSLGSVFMNTSSKASQIDPIVENQNEKTISIQEFSYTPAVLVVKAGTIVTWTNNDAIAHSATADDGSFDTGLLEKGQSGSVTLNEAGEYTYHCSVHPNMTGKIVVEE